MTAPRNVRDCLHVKKAWTALCALDPPVPEEVFNHDFLKCYCNDCESPRKRKDQGGCIPFGYTRFAIYVEPYHSESRGVFSSWLKCFHGTLHRRVAEVVKTGYLLFPGATTKDGITLQIRDGHIKKSGIKREVTFDSIRTGRCGNITNVETTDHKFLSEFDPTSCAFLTNHFGYAEHRIYAETAKLGGFMTTILLEFRVQPGSYDEATHTFTDSTLAECYTDRFSPSSSTWEWFTNRYGVMKLTGILVKVSNSIFSWLLSKRDIPEPTPLTLEKLFPNKSRENFLKFLSCPTAFQRFEILIQSGICRQLFNEEFCKCYCPSCEPNSSSIYERGKMTYKLPFGFTRFSLHIDLARQKYEEIFKTWPVAYHGTTFHNFKHILHTGILVPVGARGPDGIKVGGRDEGVLRVGRSPSTQQTEDNIFFSPVLSYAAHPIHASPSEVLLHGIKRKVSVVIMLRVRPGSYETGPSTITGFKVPRDESEYDDQEEWYTCRHSSVIPYGVLLSNPN